VRIVNRRANAPHAGSIRLVPGESSPVKTRVLLERIDQDSSAWEAVGQGMQVIQVPDEPIHAVPLKPAFSEGDRRVAPELVLGCPL